MKINLLGTDKTHPETFLFFIGLILIGTIFHSILLPAYNIRPDRLTYLHYDFVRVFVRGKEHLFREKPVHALVFKDGRKINTIGGQDTIKLRFERENT